VFALVLASAPAFAQAPANPAPAAPPPPAADPAAAPAAPLAADARLPAAAPPPPAENPPAAPLPPAPPPVEAKKPEPSDRVTVSKNGYFQPSLNLQVWAGGTHIATNPDDEWQSSLRVRRAEIRAKGEIIPKTIGYMVMFDVARLLDFTNKNVDVKDADGATVGTATVSQPPTNVRGSALMSGSNTSILQDVALTWTNDFADVSIGQFKIPVSLEGAGSASKLYFPERALVSRLYGDRRDLGLKADKKFDMFGYTLGVYNGEGQNKLDSNDQKDVALRLEVYPVKGLTIAGVGYVAVGDRDLPGTKDRVEGDVKYEANDILLQAEYIRGWDKTAATRLNGRGFYVLAGYTFFDKLQPVVRIGSVDPDKDNDEHGATAPDPLDEITAYEFGANYYFKSHDAKLQLAGSFFDPEQANQLTRFELILAAQVAF
jgi:hypothetical protein